MTAISAKPLHLTFAYERDEDGLWIAHVAEFPGIVGEGRTHEDSRDSLLRTIAATFAERRAAFLAANASLPLETITLAI